MARSGRGWDAKPPAPSRRRTGAGAQRAASPRGEPGDRSDEARLGSDLSDGAVGDSSYDARLGGSSSNGGARSGGDQRRGRSGQRGLPWSKASAERKAEESGERDPYEVAREVCMKQLSTRPRTRAELATAMKKRGVSEEVAQTVLDRYDEVGMIDDAAFARAWVSSRHRSRGLAGRALAQELRHRGVEQEVAAEALSELDPETEAQTALDLAMRKLKTTRGEPEAVFRRLVGMLARKGYSGGVAVRAVKDALATRDAELADLIDPDVYEE